MDAVLLLLMKIHWKKLWQEEYTMRCQQ